MGKRICEFHFKDGLARLGKGRIDFRAVRKALDAIDYSGRIQLESAYPPSGYADDYKFLRGIFPENG